MPYRIAYRNGMRAISSTDFRKTLAESLDRVADDHEPLLVTRPGGRNAVVVSEEDWAGMEETLYLLRSPRNAEVLLESIAELNDGRGKRHALIDE